MVRTAMKVEECCEWCRQPVNSCRAAACDDARTYSGVMRRGEWLRLEATDQVPVEASLAQAA